MTDEVFLDNLMKANLKPDALTSNDLLKFMVNPKKAICQSDLPTKFIVSEKISSSDIQVKMKSITQIAVVHCNIKNSVEKYTEL